MAKIEDLRELARGIDRNKVKNIHIIGNTNSTKTIFDEFYQLLIDSDLNSDEEFNRHFYEEKKSKQNYYKLKDRLLQRLINTVFFIDINKRKELPIQKAYYECYKHATAIKILLGKRIRIPAINLAEKVLKKALFYGFTGISIELSRNLTFHYNYMDHDPIKYSTYSKIVREQLKIYNAELKIEHYSLEIYHLHYQQVILDPIHANRFKSASKKVKKILKRHRSYKIILQGYLFLIMYHELKCDWRRLGKWCDNLNKLLEIEPKYLNPNLEGLAFSRKMLELFMCRKFKDCNLLAEKCNSIFPRGSFNWIYFQDINIRVQFHAGQFDKAKDIFVSVRKDRSKDIYFSNMNETWEIYAKFLQYLEAIGKINFEENGKQLQSTIRIQKFLNEVPNHSKDKKGSNVTILILQILFLLEQRKYDDIIDRTESLRVYIQRYLKEDGTYRSNCFIKMLLCLPAGNFERPEVSSKAQAYLDRLHAMPIRKAKQSAELEVMPYEMLWEFVLESLDRKATSN